MSEIIYKPYSVIDEEWSAICKRLGEAQRKLDITQNPMLEKYPSDEMWDKYLEAQKVYESARNEFNEYRNTVRPSD